MKLKNLKKKIRRLEKRLQEGPKKLAKLREKLKAVEVAKTMKAARKSAARASRPTAKRSTSVEKKSPAQTTAAKKPDSVEKAKRKLNLSPERRAQLAAAMKARWAARRAAEANTKAASGDDQHSAPAGPALQAPESRPDGA
jgi:hypothetical protein